MTLRMIFSGGQDENIICVIIYADQGSDRTRRRGGLQCIRNLLLARDHKEIDTRRPRAQFAPAADEISNWWWVVVVVADEVKWRT